MHLDQPVVVGDRAVDDDEDEVVVLVDLRPLPEVHGVLDGERVELEDVAEDLEVVAVGLVEVEPEELPGGEKLLDRLAAEVDLAAALVVNDVADRGAVASVGGGSAVAFSLSPSLPALARSQAGDRPPGDRTLSQRRPARAKASVGARSVAPAGRARPPPPSSPERPIRGSTGTLRRRRRPRRPRRHGRRTAPSLGPSAALADTETEWAGGMLGVVVRRLVGVEHAHDPVRLEDRGVDRAEVGEPLPAGDAAQVGERDAFTAQHPQVRPALLDQKAGLAFEQARHPGEIEDAPREHRVQPEQDERADDRAGDRHVVTDDAVLDRVCDQEQDEQVERVRLPEFPLAEDAQGNQQEEVDQDRAQDLLAETDLEMEHRMPHRRHLPTRCRSGQVTITARSGRRGSLRGGARSPAGLKRIAAPAERARSRSERSRIAVIAARPSASRHRRSSFPGPGRGEALPARLLVRSRSALGLFEAREQPPQEVVEAPLLLRRERAQEVLFVGEVGLDRPLDRLLAEVGEPDERASAVSGIGPPLDQACLGEAVETFGDPTPRRASSRRP